MGIEVPTPIQRLSIQPILDGADVIAKAETGTGKTLAFGAPIMSRMDPARRTVLALVLCPTRELAKQVADVLHRLGQARGLGVALIVGGDPPRPQVEALKAGAQVVVGTPGRVLDLHQQRYLAFPWLEFVVLDEADKMFEIGFIDDIRRILGLTPDERQTLLYSATYVDEVLALAREATRDPIEIATKAGVATVEAIEQSWIGVDENEKPDVLTRLIRNSERSDVFLIFCERRQDVDQLLRRMSRLPFRVTALHGGYDQPTRTRVMALFRAGEIKALIATDVASRGLDVHHVSHVVNYDIPRDLEAYTHRIGRTGRAGRSGIAVSLVTPRDQRRWRAIERAASWEIQRMEPPQRPPTQRRGSRRPARR